MNVAAGVVVLGDIPAHFNRDYFLTRACFIDARGGLTIGENVSFGFGVNILTRSHDIGDGDIGDVNKRPVTIADNVWVGSFTLLYNCIIGEGAIVAAGSVVRSCEIEAGVMVAGNPAEKIAVRDEAGKWVYLAPKWRKIRNVMLAENR